MPHRTDFTQIFAQLKIILQPFAHRLTIKTDEPNNYVSISAKPDEKNREIHFATVQIKKNYVSFHLMPVYTHPALLDQVSPALKKRMQGKSCFNFARADDETFDELGELAAKGFELYQQKELI